MSTTLKRWFDWLPLLIIIAVGAALRMYRIGDVPPGLYRDEGYYGLDALGILRGHLAIYFAANNGREGLFMYLLAGGIAVFGRTPEALRIVSAFIGSLTIPAIYLTGRTLFSHRIGVLSAAVLAFTFWHLAISRIAYRAILLPLMLCLCIALTARVVLQLSVQTDVVVDGRKRNRLYLQAIVAGASLGLMFYTYASAQFILVVLGGFCIAYLVLHLLRFDGFPMPRMTRQSWMVVVIYAIAATAVLSPFIIWFLRHPGMYFGRAEQVSIFSPTINKGDFLGMLLGGIQKAFGMFTIQGDRIWRHNLSLRPVFGGVLAATFVVGAVVSVWRVVKPRGRYISKSDTRSGALLLLLWLIVFLIPTILAEDTPHYLRAIGALPAACVLTAVGTEALLAWLSRRGLLNVIGPLSRIVSPPALIATVLIVLSARTTVTDYFDIYANQDMTAYWLEDENVQLANLVNEFTANHAQHEGTALWLDDRLTNDNPSLRFLSPAVELEQVIFVGDNRGIPPPPASVELVVDPNHDWTRLRNALPKGSVMRVEPGPMAQGDNDQTSRRAYIRVIAQQPALDTTAVHFEQGILLRQVDIHSRSQGLFVSGSQLPLVTSPIPMLSSMDSSQIYTITAYWSTNLPIPSDYAVFVHWWRDGKVIAQNDSTPAQGYLPMPTWRPGDVIMDEHALTVPGGMRVGDEVRLGIYRREGNVRLRVLDNDAQPVSDSTVILVTGSAQ